MKFCWTTIQVKNLEASLDFYQNIVGLPIKRQFTSEGKQLVFLGEGETQVELIYDPANKKIQHSPDISLGFVVESLQKHMALMQSKGIALYAGPFKPNPGIQFLYALDPNGVKIQFVENL